MPHPKNALQNLIRKGKEAQTIVRVATSAELFALEREMEIILHLCHQELDYRYPGYNSEESKETNYCWAGKGGKV